MGKKREPDEIAQAVAGLGKPFSDAKAALARARSSAASPDKIESLRAEVLRQLYASKELDAAVQRYTKKVMKEDDGKRFRFAGWPPKKTLQDIVRAKGMSQSELARKAKMDPAMLSRVFKNPDNSKLGTLRRIAKALDVELAQVI